MKFNLREFYAAFAVATLIAAAVDLCLSATHGYYLRLDRVPLLAWELFGVGLVCFVVMAGLACVAFALARMRARVPSVPGAVCLLSAWTPIALIIAWRHREPVLLAATGVAALGVLLIAALEVRGKFRSVGPAFAMAGVIASAGAIGASILLPLPGRDLVGAAPAGPVVGRPGPNLLFIVLDTLRADHVGAYGYARATTPWLDEFAKGATVYERMEASSSYTLPTHATLFTGLFAETHGALETLSTGDTGLSLSDLGLQADVAKVSPLSDDAETLAELMAARGYDTAAICANSAYLSRAFNLDQGFQTYVDATGSRSAWRPAGLSLAIRLPLPQKWRVQRMLDSNDRYYLFAHEVNALAYRWMRGRSERPFFLFLNYMDVHAPYFPPPPYRDAFPEAYARQTADWNAINRRERTLAAEEKAALVDAYDASLVSLDTRLKELFAKLNAAGMLDNTVVLFASDHGEGFGEHGTLGHAMSLYEPEVHVPLIIRRPGQTAGERVSRVVHMADVAPTVMRELGVPVPEAVEGTDLASEQRKYPIVNSLGPYERSYSEYGVYSEPWKLVWRSDAPPALYDLRADPAESVDRAEDQPAIVASLLAKLDEYRNRPSKKLGGGAMILDEETQERLKAIGYGEK